jgi:hypothetical protein
MAIAHGRKWHQADDFDAAEIASKVGIYGLAQHVFQTGMIIGP